MARLGAKITATGVTRAMQRLEAAGHLATHARRTMDDLAAEAPSAITNVREDTGRLAASIHNPSDPEHVVETYQDGYKVGTAVWYSHFVFRGTKYHPAAKPRIARKRLTEEAAALLAQQLADVGT
jgi:hypothetical protein